MTSPTQNLERNEARPSDRHMEAAVALRRAVNWSSNGSVEHIARALASAEREGMKRAAGISDEHAIILRKVFANDCARAVQGVRDAILSEAGERA